MQQQNRWDERYGGEEYVFGTEPNDFLKSVAARIPRGRVLCLADGEGRNGVFLAEQGCDVVSVDASAVGLEKARRLAESRGVTIETVQADLADYEIAPEAWDGVVSIFCHLPPELRRSVHQRVVAGLKPGGAFVLEAYTPDQLRYGTGGPPTADLMPTLAELRAELAGLAFEHAAETERAVVEGAGHTGLAAVVQVFAVKPAPAG
jgi:Cyclopropane fatty acid synthase and related methyltransferases